MKFERRIFARRSLRSFTWKPFLPGCMSSSEYFLGSRMVHSHAGYSSSASATTGAWPFNHVNPGITVSFGQLLVTVIINENKAFG